MNTELYERHSVMEKRNLETRQKYQQRGCYIPSSGTQTPDTMHIQTDLDHTSDYLSTQFLGMSKSKKHNVPQILEDSRKTQAKLEPDGNWIQY